MCLVFALSGYSQRKVVVGVTEDDFVGAIKDGKYTNDFFGLTFQIPVGWQALTYEEMSTAKTIGLEGMKSNEAKTDNALAKAGKAEAVILAISKKPLGSIENAVLAVGAAKQPSSAITPKMVATASRSILLANPKNKSVEDIRIETIGGKQFATFVLDMDLFGNTIRLRYYATMVRSYSLTFSMSNVDPDLDQLLKTVSFRSK